MFNERLIPWFGTGTADALFLKKQANVCWASGFMGKDSCVLMTPDGGFLFTDPRYTEQAGIEAPDFTLVNWRAVGGSMMKALAHVIKEQKIGSVGFEADTLPSESTASCRARRTRGWSPRRMWWRSFGASRRRRRSDTCGHPARSPAGPSTGFSAISGWASPRRSWPPG